MSRRSKLLLTVIAVQIAVPAAALSVSPARFGFQMYSGTGWTHVVVTRHDGSTTEIFPTEYVANYRSEIDWTKRLPERICTQDDSVVSVTVNRWHEERTLTCP